MLKRFFRNENHGQKGITGLETAIILIAFVVVAAVFAYTVLSAGLFATQKSSEAVYSGLESAQSTLEMKGGVTAYASIAGGSGQVTDTFSTAAGGTPAAIGEAVTRIQFTIGNVAAGEPINMASSGTLNGTEDTVDIPTEDLARLSGADDQHTTIVSYDDQYNHFSDCTWTANFIGKNDGDDLLEADEKVMITVWLMDADFAGTGTDSFALNAADASGDYYFSNSDETSSYLIDTDHEFRLELKPAEGAAMLIERTTPANLDDVMDLH
jgi:flagellin FlaB